MSPQTVLRPKRGHNRTRASPRKFHGRFPSPDNVEAVAPGTLPDNLVAQFESAPHRFRLEQDPIIDSQVVKAITSHACDIGKDRRNL
jgi:hypothetical protein